MTARRTIVGSMVAGTMGFLALLVSVASAGVDVWTETGTILDNAAHTDSAKFKNLSVSENGAGLTVSFDYTITASNGGQIDQLLVAVGDVVKVAWSGTVGGGKHGRASVTFERPNGNFKIILALTAGVSDKDAIEKYGRDEAWKTAAVAGGE